MGISSNTAGKLEPKLVGPAAQTSLPSAHHLLNSRYKLESALNVSFDHRGLCLMRVVQAVSSQAVRQGKRPPKHSPGLGHLTCYNNSAAFVLQVYHVYIHTSLSSDDH